MASRLYPTIRRLFWQVVKALRQIGLGAALSLLAFSLLALYVAGLILLDKRQGEGFPHSSPSLVRWDLEDPGGLQARAFQ